MGRKRGIKLMALTLCAAMLSAAIPAISFAESEKEYRAEIAYVYGDADAVVTLTFDDGHYPTA